MAASRCCGNFFTTAAHQQDVSRSEPVIVAGDETDQHYGLGAIFEQPVKSFERALAIVGEQMIAEFEI
jgi:hypothetical protein